MKRYGFIGITVEQDKNPGAAVQKILSDYQDIILGRMGLPRIDGGNISVITLIVKATSDEVGALTGKLGKIDGVNVKSGLSKV